MFLRDVRRVGVVTLWAVAATLLNFLAGILLARVLGPGDRGLVAVVVSAAGLVAVFSALGTNVAVRAQLPRSDEINLRGFWAVTLLLSAGLALPLLVVVGMASGVLVDERLGEVGWLAAFTACGLGAFLWFQVKEALAAVGLIARGAVINAAGSLAFLALVGLLAGKSHLTAGAAVLAYAASTGLQFGAALGPLAPTVRGTRARGTRALLRSGPVYLGYHFGQDVVFRLDRYLLGVLSSPAMAGLFTVAVSLAEVLRLPALASGQFALFDAASRTVSVRAVVARTLQWTAVLTAVALPLALVAPWLVTVLYGVQFAGAVTPFRILLGAQVLLVPFLILSRVLVGLGGRSSASLPGLAGLVVLVGVGAALMPSGGATGAAIACAAAYLTMSVTAALALRHVVGP